MMARLLCGAHRCCRFMLDKPRYRLNSAKFVAESRQTLPRSSKLNRTGRRQALPFGGKVPKGVQMARAPGVKTEEAPRERHKRSRCCADFVRIMCPAGIPWALRHGRASRAS